MTISLPYQSPEIEYVTHVLLGHLLGLRYKVEYLPETPGVVRLCLRNGNHLQLSVGAWLENPQYGFHHIPSNIQWLSRDQNPFLPGEDLPVLFGSAETHISKNKIVVGADIFSATYFMLSRWEECVVPERDPYGRFPASAALAVKSGFYHRPIVDEYAEMLWSMLQHLGIDQARKTWEYKFLPTHDIDNPRKWRGPFTLLRTLGGDLLKRRSPGMAVQSWKSYRNTLLGREKDPYDNFDYLMDCSERHGLQSHFFFLCGGSTPFDREALPPSHPVVRQIFDKIHRRGHVIGFHPSFQASADEKLFERELSLLQEHSPQPVRCGRQHYLRFQVPLTWQFWERAGMNWESSMVYPERAGFRCGICREFPVFDLESRKMLRFFELPLTLMERTWLSYQTNSAGEFLRDARTLIDVVKKYRGTFVLLWHNSTINNHMHPPAGLLYEKILSYGSTGN